MVAYHTVLCTILVISIFNCDLIVIFRSVPAGGHTKIVLVGLRDEYNFPELAGHPAHGVYQVGAHGHHHYHAQCRVEEGASRDVLRLGENHAAVAQG